MNCNTIQQSNHVLITSDYMYHLYDKNVQSFVPEESATFNFNYNKQSSAKHRHFQTSYASNLILLYFFAVGILSAKGNCYKNTGIALLFNLNGRINNKASSNPLNKLSTSFPFAFCILFSSVFLTILKCICRQ